MPNDERHDTGIHPAPETQPAPPFGGVNHPPAPPAAVNVPDPVEDARKERLVQLENRYGVSGAQDVLREEAAARQRAADDAAEVLRREAAEQKHAADVVRRKAVERKNELLRRQAAERQDDDHTS